MNEFASELSRIPKSFENLLMITPDGVTSKNSQGLRNWVEGGGRCCGLGRGVEFSMAVESERII